MAELINWLILKSIFGCSAQHAGSWFPKQGSNPCPLQWKRRVLTTEWPGNFMNLQEKEFYFFCLEDWFKKILLLFSNQVVSDSLWPHGLKHVRLPCASSSPRLCQHLSPLNRVVLLVFTSDNAWPRFSFRSFMVSYLIFMSLNHFEFIFVSGVRE